MSKEISRCVKFSQDANFIAISYPASAYGWGDTIIYDAETYKIIQTLRIDKSMYVYEFPFHFENEGLCFSKDNNKLYTLTHWGNFREWDISSGKELNNFSTRGSSPFAIFPDETKCLVKRGIYSLVDGKELFLDEGLLFLTTTYKVLHQKGDMNNQYQYKITQLNLDTFEILASYPEFISYNGYMKLSPSGNYYYNKNYIYNVRNNRLLGSLSTKKSDSDKEKSIDDIVFSLDETLIAAISGKMVYIYKTSDITSSVQNAEQQEQ